jgi:hypothetical protein
MAMDNKRKQEVLARARKAIDAAEEELRKSKTQRSIMESEEKLQKIRVVARHLKTLDMELQEILALSEDVISSHYSKMAKDKKNPHQNRALELIAQFKASGERGFIKAAYRAFDIENPGIYKYDSFTTLYKRHKKEL